MHNFPSESHNLGHRFRSDDSSSEASDLGASASASRRQ